MKLDANLYNNLKSIRTRLGMSQQDLANMAGVTRQSIGGIESGLYAPSVAMSLRLAKALGCQVENLFWFEKDLPEVEAVLTTAVKSNQQLQELRVSLARVGGQWRAYPLIGNNAFRIEMIPADGEAVVVSHPFIESDVCIEFYDESEAQKHTGTNKVLVRLLDDMEKLQNTVVIAGCTPMVSLWARAAERWYPQLRVHHILSNSMTALHSLCRGEVHIAGMHLYDHQTGEHNIPFVREALAGKSAVLINLGVCEEGLLVSPGNPKGIKTVTDLLKLGITIVNREPGCSSRMLLERKLQEEQVASHMVIGFDHIVYNHQDVALSVVSGSADAGVSQASVATTFGLGFIPLHRSRYDLVILKEYLEEAPVQQLLSTLELRLVKSQLELLGGYDISNIGEVVANI